MIKKTGIATTTLSLLTLLLTSLSAENYSYSDSASSNLFKSYSESIPSQCTLTSGISGYLSGCSTSECPPVPSLNVQAIINGPQGGGVANIYINGYAGGSSSDSFTVLNKPSGNYYIAHIVSFGNGGTGYATLDSVIHW